MTAVLELTNWEKFSVLSWKNLYVTLKSYKVALYVILIPPCFCLTLVLIRILTNVTYHPASVFRPMFTNVSWTQFLEEIETRREIIRQTKPDFQHSTYVPQPVLAFTPPSELFVEMMSEAIQNDISGVGVISFKTCDELKEAMKIQHYFAGICFIYESKIAINLEMKIIFPSELRVYNDSYIGASWNTNEYFDFYNSFEKRQTGPHDGGYLGYIREGFTAIQNAIAMAYIRRHMRFTLETPKIQRFPFHANYDDQLTGSIAVSMSLALVCGFIYPALTLTNGIVREKRRHVKNILKVMGLENWIQMLAWFAKFFILMLISSVLIIFLLKIEWTDARGILPKSSLWALFLCLSAYVTAAVSFCIMMASFFSDPKIAVPLTCIIWFCSYLPYIAVVHRDLLAYLRPAMFCFCNTVLALLFDLIIEFEKFGNGMQLSSLIETQSSHRDFSAAVYISILFALSIVYILIALYVEGLDFSYDAFSKKINAIFRPDGARKNGRRLNVNLRQSAVYEIEHAYKNIMIKMENVSKDFRGLPAVKNVYMNLYEGDITVLMGHNGSGKTVLLQMIAGMITPTTGKMEIQGLDIEKNKTIARKNLGICLDGDLPFPELNVVDQLIFFARLRGLVSPQLEKEVQRYMDVMHLNHRRHYPTNMLSKGERRFLSVCCALIGQCKIILLDEPSLRLDLLAKEALWELLRTESKNRSIVLTTHCEEEAEALADQIGVFCGGELKCFGSAFFLKKIYGQGHRLICYKARDFNRNMLKNVIQSHIPLASIESEIGNQISYILGDIKSFSILFDDLEDKAKEIGINGISVAEMNSADIFLRVGAQNPSEGNRQRHSEMLNGDTIYRRQSIEPRMDGGAERITGCRLFINQCQVMLLKRFISSLRIMLLSLLQLTMPILFTVVSFSLLTYDHDRAPLRDITFTLNQYPYSITLYHIDPDVSSDKDYNFIYEGFEEELFWTGPSQMAEKIPINVRSVNRYILEKQAKTTDFVNNAYLVGINVNKPFLTAFFNNYPLHTAPLALNVLYNSILSGLFPDARIKTTFSPLPYASNNDLVIKNLPVSIGNYLAVNISFCVSFTWSMSIIFLVRERKSNFKFFQHIFGVHGYVFWMNTFIFDVAIIIITTLIILLSIVFFELDIFMDEGTSGSYFLILVVAGACMCSANYLVSVIWNDPIRAYITIIVFNALGTMSFWAYLEVFEKGFERHENQALFESIMQLLPHFSLCKALVTSFNIAEVKTVCKDEEIKILFENLRECHIFPHCCTQRSVWSYRGGIFSDLIYIFGYGLVCWVLLCIVENYEFWSRKIEHDTMNEDPKRYAFESDSDTLDTNNSFEHLSEMAAKQEQEILDIDPVTNKQKILVSNRVSSKVRNYYLVNQITFAVNRGENFTILGKNASGKSALIKTLIGCAPLSQGKVHIDGLNLRSNLRGIYERIGYCSQDEAFLPEFKLFELMQMACILRGIPNREVMDVCEYLANILGFQTNLQKKYEICSTGVRKRFCCACALIGNPRVVFFDCATSNLDIAGRRQLWNVAGRLRAQGQSCVFSTTSVTHFEKITDHLMILSNGRLILLSDPWSICQNYEKGYILSVKVRKITIMLPTSDESLLTPKYHTVSANTFLKLATFIENEFPLFQVKGQLGNTIEYFIPFESTSLSHIFRVMQRNSFNLYVEDFSITTLTLSTFIMETMKQQRRKR